VPTCGRKSLPRFLASWQDRWQDLEQEDRQTDLHRIGPLTRDHKAALWRPDRPDLARRFDAWLLAAEATGRLDELRRRHGLPSERTAEPGAALLVRLDERLSLMPAVARTKASLARPIEDPAREARVLAAARRGVVGAARRAGRPAPAEPVIDELFQAQMEAARWIQIRELTVPSNAALAPRSASPVSADAARTELEHVLRPALIRIGDRLAELLVAWSASKSFAQYGSRVGCLIAVTPDDGERERIRNALAFSCRGTWSNCNHLGILAITKLLTDPELKARVDAERARLKALIDERVAVFNREAARVGLRTPRYEGGFFVAVFTSDAGATAAGAREEGVFVVPMKGAVRVALCSTPAKDVPRLVEVLGRHVS